MKDNPMMTMSTAAAASPDQTPSARANAAQAASVAASARAAVRATDAAGAANDAKMATTQAATSAPAPVPDMMDGISTLAMANAVQTSLPATLAQLNHLAVVGASGQLTDADRATLRAEYAQLAQQVASVVGTAAVAQAAEDAPTDKDRRRDDSYTGQNTQDSDDRRSTLTRDDVQSPITVQGEPTEQLVTTTKAVEVGVDAGPRITPRVNLVTHELHVGTDSYEPVQVRQSRTQLSRPEASATYEQRSTTHRVMVQHVTQIAQMSQVAQVTHVNVVV